jgi:hypothetical protein
LIGSISSVKSWRVMRRGRGDGWTDGRSFFWESRVTGPEPIVSTIKEHSYHIITAHAVAFFRTHESYVLETLVHPGIYTDSALLLHWMDTIDQQCFTFTGKSFLTDS